MAICKKVKKKQSLCQIIIQLGMTLNCKSKSELIKKIWDYCRNNNLKTNTKGTPITTLSIRNCLNEIIRYIVSKKRGYWQDYKIIDNENVFRIEKEVKYFD